MDMRNGEEYLSFVTEKIRGKIEELGISIEEGERDVWRMNEYYWENYTEMDEYGYENYDNQQALLLQMSANEDQLKLRRRYVRMLSSPFFGRVDFCFEGEDAPELVYIGIGNFSEDAALTPLIYDWRAPICSLFYDFDQGEASYEAPGGTMYGEIVSKWQYKIRNGRMIYAFESDIKIDDEVLKAELGQAGETRLKNIIRTIQKEQNTIIRNTKDKIMVIQGAAGSGKTSIALHRIAYLLYHDRKNLKSSNILILSPNGIFADYISQILPELGEENIREMTFDLYAYRQLKGIVYDCEDRYDQIERELALAVNLDPVSLEAAKKAEERYLFKQSRDFMNLLEGYLIRLEDDLMNFRDVSYKGNVLTQEEILTLFYERFAEIPLLARMGMIAEYFIDAIETLKGKALSAPDREMLTEKFDGMYETTDIYRLYRRFLMETDFAFGSSTAKAAKSSSENVESTCRLSFWEEENPGFLPDVPLEKRRLRYEDVYPMLYLKYRLCQHRPDTSVRHLVVDEMQDYTWMQYVILQKMFSCKMTILGDKAQTIEPEPRDVMRFLPRILGRNIRFISMNKCYRNTVEIAGYANGMADIDQIECVQRHGAPVQDQRFDSWKEAIDAIALDLKENLLSFETAAVITLTADESKKAFEMLKDSVDQLSLLHKDSKGFRKGISVTTFYLAKGLEFERVYALLPADTSHPMLRQANYITATRAMHELKVYRLQNQAFVDANIGSEIDRNGLDG